MDAKQKMLKHRELIAKLTYSEKGDIHQLLETYRTRGWLIDNDTKKIISDYILFLETELEKLL